MSYISAVVIVLTGVLGVQLLPSSASVALPASANVDSLPSRTPVAEGVVRYAFNNAEVIIPATVQGHPVTFLLGFGIDADVSLDPAALASAGVTLSDSTHLDTLTLGTSVVHDMALQTISQVPGNPQPGMPPLVGILGNVFLARYDIVYDGPARRVRLYERFSPNPTTSSSSHHPWLPPAIAATASCTPMLPLPEHNAAFVIQVNAHPVPAILETLSSYTKMNMVAARAIGLTQHSTNVHPLPDDIWEKQDVYGHPVKYQATEIHLTLGTQHFDEVPILLFPGLDLDRYQSPIPPLLLLNPDDVQHQMLVFSQSTRQICLGSHQSPARR